VSGITNGTEVVSGPFRAVAKSLKDGAAVVVKDAKSISKVDIKEEENEEK
jgi:HlyD family secretion protein